MVDNKPDSKEGDYAELLEKLARTIPELTSLLDKLIEHQDKFGDKLEKELHPIRLRIDKVYDYLFFGNGKDPLTSRVEILERDAASAYKISEIDRRGRWKILAAMLTSSAALITAIITALL